MDSGYRGYRRALPFARTVNPRIEGVLMRRFGRSWRKGAVLALALAVIVFVSVTAVGFPGGIVFAIALGTATAVAVYSDSRHAGCRRRSSR